MNAAARLLERCRCAGIALTVNADRELCINYNGAIQGWLLEEINTHRLELISLLTADKPKRAPTFADVVAFANRFDYE